MERKWWLIDAEGKVLGRVATRITEVLMGKHKPGYLPYKDEGDYVICINAEKIVATGNKESGKIYTHYSGYRGGLTRTELARMRTLHPERILMHAVHGMLPKNRLNAPRLKRLKVYKGVSHPHSAQKLAKLEVPHYSGKK